MNALTACFLACLLALSGATKAASPVTRALVVGVGQYRDAALPPLPHSTRDATFFTAWLRSGSGGRVEPDNLRLLTDERATVGRLAEALDWLAEETRPGDRVFVWFEGYAAPGHEGCPELLFLHDSPLADPAAGAISARWIDQTLTQLAREKRADFALFLLAHLPPENDLTTPKPEPQTATPPNLPPETFSRCIPARPQGERPPSGLLTNALLGQADCDDDQRIFPWELVKYLSEASFSQPHSLRLTCSSSVLLLARVEEMWGFQEKFSEKSPLPVLIRQETTAWEDSTLAAAGATAVYEDFVLAIRTGHLLEPPVNSALIWYDSLLAHPGLAALHSRFRRRLAAAFQDEVQQALNAYLQSDSREMRLRYEKSKHYGLLTAYLAQADRLLGSRHFMHNTLEAKRLYFLGLEMRFRAENPLAPDSAALRQALEIQQKALATLPDAPFILNEIGVILDRRGSPGADSFFTEAARLAPRWSIPYFNLSILENKAGHLDDAIRLGNVAVAFSPNAVFALNHLGSLFLKKKQLDLAEPLLRRAVGLDLHYAEAWYNLGCLFALRGVPDEAFFFLENATREGFSDWKLLASDPDLDALRGQQRFQDLMEKVAGRD